MSPLSTLEKYLRNAVDATIQLKEGLAASGQALWLERDDSRTF
jgi:hypothetical protein